VAGEHQLGEPDRSRVYGNCSLKFFGSFEVKSKINQCTVSVVVPTLSLSSNANLSDSTPECCAISSVFFFQRSGLQTSQTSRFIMPVFVSSDTNWTTSLVLDTLVMVMDGVTLRIQGGSECLSVTLSNADNTAGIQLRTNAKVVVDNVLMKGSIGIKHFGIKVADSNDGLATIEVRNLACQNVAHCIYQCGTFNGKIDVADSVFVNNDLAVRARGNATVHNCLFLRNREGILANWMTITNSTVVDHGNCGLWLPAPSIVRDSVFIANEIGLREPEGEATNLLFCRNEWAVHQPRCCLSRSTFLKNDVDVIHYVAGTSGGTAPAAQEVNFIDTLECAVKNGQSHDVNCANLRWGTTDMDAVSSRILDFYEEPRSRGRVNADPIAAEPFEHDLFPLSMSDWEPPASLLGFPLGRTPSPTAPPTTRPTQAPTPLPGAPVFYVNPLPASLVDLDPTPSPTQAP